jgi:hypothetical protein
MCLLKPATIWLLLGIFVGLYALMRFGKKGLEPGYAFVAALILFEVLVIASGSWHDQIAFFKSL